MGKFRLFASNGNSYNTFLPFKKETVGVGIHGPVYTVNGNQALVIYSQDDVIYSIANDSVSPKYKVQFNNKKVVYYSGKVETVFDNPPCRVIGIDAIFESDNYLFINVNYTTSKNPIGKGNYDTYICLYNKLDSTQIIYPQWETVNSIFDNEQIIVKRIIDNKIVVWREAGMLAIAKEYLYKDKVFKNKAYEARLKSVLANLTEDDNPILFIFNLK
jgi:hypothetical protein